MELASHNMTVNGCNLKYYQAGEAGDPVLLLHGGGTDHARLSWELTYPTLAPNHRVIMPDWPGYGGSELAKNPFSIDLLGDTLAGLMDGLAIDTASLVGVSMGGAAAMGFTLAHAERVAKLVLVDSYGMQARAPWHKLSYLTVRIPYLVPMSWALLRRSRRLTRWTLGTILTNPQAITPELVEEVYQAMQSEKTGRAFYEFQNREMTWDGLHTCYMERLGEIHQHTLLIHGETDRLVPLAAAKESVERLPHADLEILANCGHWPQRDQPAAFNRLVADFLRSNKV